MCFYCGCREVPLIREFIAEHETVTDLAAQAAEAIEGGEYEHARKLLDVTGEHLEAHWQGEEQGLFLVMHSEDLYAGYIDALVAEHRELRTLLATADLRVTADRSRILAAIDGLHEHIAKEEDGLFPASLSALSGDQWDYSLDAWHRAHPSGD